MIDWMGFGQQTGAMRMGQMRTARVTRTRRKKTKRVASAPRARKKKRSKARLVKGSAAARAYMAKIRKMRRR